MEENEIQALTLTAEENYAHARDHEHLRAQITSILVAASFVLTGLSLDKDVLEINKYFAAALNVAIGILNIHLITIHSNRFDLHVDVARQAKKILDSNGKTKGIRPTIEKRGNLKAAWILVASLPIIIGVFTTLILATCNFHKIFTS